MTILFVAPLQKELDFFTEGLYRHGYQSTPISAGRMVVHHFSALDITVARGGHGKTQFGIQTQYLLDHMQAVQALICVGAAGALASELAVGDLVVATETVEHDYLERFLPLHPLPRFAGDGVLLATMQRIARQSFPFAVHFGIVASGDEDVIEVERAAALRQATEACAVAWEGAGGARACLFSGIPFLELRCITDTADHNASADFTANLHIAMASAAALVAVWRHKMMK